MKTVDLPENLEYINAHSFEDDPKLETVICRAKNPPTLEADTFGGTTPQASITLKVPVASISAYQAADNWKEFDVVALGAGE